MGGIRFGQITLEADETAEYVIIIGITEQEEEIDNTVLKYASSSKVEQALEKVKEYWQEKVNVRYHTGDSCFDLFMRWVSFQPFLRRIYGCSFLPHHDYGRGGRGWRDLWQDCLSLLLMDPKDVRQMIVSRLILRSVFPEICANTISARRFSVISGAKRSDFLPIIQIKSTD